MFSTYFELGLRHIADIDAYDHMVFLLALIAVYQFKDIKKIFWLVTAFTVGHSLTLALSALQLVQINAAYIEFLIPMTILFTAVSNLVLGLRKGKNNVKLSYLLTLFFGLIHGLGFSGYLKSILGKTDVLIPLIAFNLGVEVGQLIIVLVVMLSTTLLWKVFRLNQQHWVLVISGICIGVALVLAKQTVFW